MSVAVAVVDIVVDNTGPMSLHTDVAVDNTPHSLLSAPSRPYVPKYNP